MAQARQERAGTSVEKLLLRFTNIKCTEFTFTDVTLSNTGQYIQSATELTSCFNLFTNLDQGAGSTNNIVGTELEVIAIEGSIALRLPPVTEGPSQDINATTVSYAFFQRRGEGVTVPAEYWDSSLKTTFAPIGFPNPDRNMTFNTLKKDFVMLDKTSNRSYVIEIQALGGNLFDRVEFEEPEEDTASTNPDNNNDEKGYRKVNLQLPASVGQLPVGQMPNNGDVSLLLLGTEPFVTGQTNPNAPKASGWFRTYFSEK